MDSFPVLEKLITKSRKGSSHERPDLLYEPLFLASIKAEFYFEGFSEMRLLYF
jgi:hypothetical protein